MPPTESHQQPVYIVQRDHGGFLGFVLGILVILAVAILFYVFALPYINNYLEQQNKNQQQAEQNSSTTTTKEYVVPSDINVKIDRNVKRSIDNSSGDQTTQ